MTPSIGSSVTASAASAGSYVNSRCDVSGSRLGEWDHANYGFALSSANADLVLDSKENDETGHAATLDVTITSMGATGGFKARWGDWPDDGERHW